MFTSLHAMPKGSAGWRRQRDRIVHRCLPMADHIAQRYSQRGQPFDDLVQVARIGLLGAIDRFDPAKSTCFVAYAVVTMTGAVRHHFRDHCWMMHVPRGVRDQHSELSSAQAELAQQFGRAPTPSELASELGVDRQTVVEWIIASDVYRLRSLDAPLQHGDEDGHALGDAVGANDDRIELMINLVSLRPLIDSLSDLDRDVLEMRFCQSLSQSQIAEKIGTSQMQVSRILSRTLTRLRLQLTQ